MAKKDPFLQQLERRRQQHLVSTPSHVDKPAPEMDDAELDRETKRLQWEKTKAETEYWQQKKNETLGDGIAFGLASNNRTNTGLASVLGDLRRTRRRGWK